MAPASPTVARWELSLRLRESREKLGLTAAEVARQLDVTPNYLSLIENDKTLLTEDKLRALAGVYSLDEDVLQHLNNLRDLGRQRGWWTEYTDASDLYASSLGRLYGLEHGARQIRAYEAHVINGLLQTEEYARSLIGSDPLVDAMRAESLIRLRRRRQNRLIDQKDPLSLTVIMSQATLLQQVGSKQCLIDQLSFLITASRSIPTIEIRIVPFSRPLGGATACSTFYLLDFDGDLPTVTWMEAAVIIGLSSEEPRSNELALRFNDALAASIDREQSIELVEECREIVRKR